jgi:hypothetical protein
MNYEIKHTDDVEEAIVLIFSGLLFFLKNHTKKTIIAILLICGSIVYVAFDYFTSDKIKMERLKPLTEEISLFPNLYAQGKNPIIFDGKYYGEQDTDYIIYKLRYSDELIIYNKRLKYGYKIEIPALEKFKK